MHTDGCRHTHRYIQVHRHTDAHRCTHAYTHRYTHKYTQVHTDAHIHTHRYTHKYTQAHTQIYTSTHRCTEVHIQMFTGTHRDIHTGAHEYTCRNIHRYSQVHTSTPTLAHRFLQLVCDTHLHLSLTQGPWFKSSHLWISALVTLFLECWSQVALPCAQHGGSSQQLGSPCGHPPPWPSSLVLVVLQGRDLAWPPPLWWGALWGVQWAGGRTVALPHHGEELAPWPPPSRSFLVTSALATCGCWAHSRNSFYFILKASLWATEPCLWEPMVRGSRTTDLPVAPCSQCQSSGLTPPD